MSLIIFPSCKTPNTFPFQPSPQESVKVKCTLARLVVVEEEESDVESEVESDVESDVESEDESEVEESDVQSVVVSGAGVTFED